MSRYYQTIGRIGAGLAAIGAMALLLWPDDLTRFLNGAPLITFIGLLMAWIAAEIKTSEEVQLRNSSANDIRLAQRLLGYHAEQFRILLKNHDFYSSIDTRYLDEANLLSTEYRISKILFQNKRLPESLESFFKNLDPLLMHIASHTVPTLIGNHSRTSFKNKTEILSETAFSHEKYLIAKANELASAAWDSFDALAVKIRREIPEALDDKLEIVWYTSGRES